MKIIYEFSYIINYKPLLNYKNKIFKYNFNIYCKNFFIFFLLMDFLKRKLYNKNLKIIIKRKLYYSNFFLRAPNKYKKAQIKINLIRYKIKIVLINNYNFNILFLYDNNILINYFINYLFYFFLFFESLFFFLEKKKIYIKLKFNINMLIKNKIEI